jgi:hypothetical protein
MFSAMKTYKLTQAAPPAMSRKEYENLAIQEWDQILNGPQASDEAVIHSFLERNPSFIPGPFSFPTSGHYPIFCGVFSKPPLAGIGNHVPDFMWLATATGLIYPMFVEIETPTKRWFTESGQPRAEWTQARNQLVEWKSWMKKPANQLVLLQSLGVPERYARYDIRPQFILVYGRRSEFEARPELRSRMAMQTGEDEFHITFDRLTPDANASDFFTLKKERTGVTALVVPPTIELGPCMSFGSLEVKGRPEAALRELRMSPERRQFVASRFPYWDAWADNSSLFQSGDVE